jgi:hypothetical protein
MNQVMSHSSTSEGSPKVRSIAVPTPHDDRPRFFDDTGAGIQDLNVYGQSIATMESSNSADMRAGVDAVVVASSVMFGRHLHL